MMKKNLLLTAFALAAAASASAQEVRVVRPKLATRVDDSNAPRIGVYLGESSMKDTAGVLVSSVIKDSPAEKAGIKEGDRIVAINGVNLKMTRDDAEDPALNGMMTRRLTRELEKLKAGDEVDLRVATGGTARSVKVKTVAAHDLETAMTPLKSTMGRSFTWTSNEDRAAVGIGLGGSASKRDTLGVFVASVSPDGPAEKAGIVEGDRIAKINGTDLRVQAPEAGESNMSRAMVSRFNRELGKLKAGDAATLTVVSGGHSRDVKVTTVKPSELHGTDGFFFGDGALFMPGFEKMQNFNWDSFPQLKAIPPGTMRTFKLPDGGGQIYQFNDGEKIRADVKEKIEKAMEKARESIERARVISADKKATVIREPVKIKPPVKVIRIAT